MLTRRMFWATVAVATAAASVFAWLMIKATDDYPYTLAPPQAPSDSLALPTQTPLQATNGTVTKAVAVHLKAAIDAIKRKEFAYALSLLAQAEAVANKTLFDNYKISEVRAYLYGQQKDYKGLLKAYDDMLTKSNNRQFLSPEQAAALTDKTMAQLAAATGDYPRAITLSESWLKEHPDDAEILGLLTQSYFSIKNYLWCRDTAAHAIALAERANRIPNEGWLQFMRSCADSLGDQDTAAIALEKLCKYFPKPDYWKSYIRAKSRNATNLAGYYWLRLSVDAVRNIETDDYSSFAQQSLLEFNLPTTGVRAIEQGIAIGLFPPNTRQRNRIEIALRSCQVAAHSARERLSLLAQQAVSDPTGQKDHEVGLIYFDNEQYSEAIPALAQAIAKARFKDLSHARMTLAIAHLESGNHEAARKLFTLAASDPALERVAHAWIVRTYN